ncbi:MAG: hypothetical protein HAW59_06195 [Betaproteobacteria bacterium]|nr:hypothetical protein [Betaproteobacteria bacterium]
MKFIYDSETLKSAAEDAVRLACKNGADAAEAGASESVGMSVDARGGKMDGMESLILIKAILRKRLNIRYKKLPIPLPIKTCRRNGSFVPKRIKTIKNQVGINLG